MVVGIVTVPKNVVYWQWCDPLIVSSLFAKEIPSEKQTELFKPCPRRAGGQDL